MIARNESVKVLYPSETEGQVNKPVAVILNGSRPPVVYRIEILDSDHLANLFENGDPDVESNILNKGKT